MKARIKPNGKIVEVVSRFMPKKRNVPSRDWMCNLSDGTCIDESQLEYIDAPKGLEEAAEEWAENEAYGKSDAEFEMAYKGFIAGAEWQKEQDLAEMAQSKSPLSVAYANRCFENGKQAMKEQMLKDAEEYELYWDGDFLAIDLNMAALGYSERDKVKVIVLKAEEE